MNPDNIVFVDIETTGLDMRMHVPWEVAIIDIHTNVLLHEMWKPPAEDMVLADPSALKMNKFYERINAPENRHRTGNGPNIIAQNIARHTVGKHMGGAAVHFDMKMLESFMTENGAPPVWHHRPMDVETYAAGVVGKSGPRSLGDTAKMLDIDYDSDMKHSALYDAWLARECYVQCLKMIGESWAADDPLYGRVPFDQVGKVGDTKLGAAVMPTPPPMGTPDAG